jgi:hypothetical protein
MADEEDTDPYIALIPGGGWMIYHSKAKSGWSDPVVAWALCASGGAVPLEADHDGTVRPLKAPAADAEIWHPESSSRRAQDRLQHHRNELNAGGT